MNVLTTEGMIEESLLEITDIITLENNARVTATEWRLNNKVVRRDVNVNVLRGLDVGQSNGNLG